MTTPTRRLSLIPALVPLSLAALLSQACGEVKDNVGAGSTGAATQNTPTSTSTASSPGATTSTGGATDDTGGNSNKTGSDAPTTSDSAGSTSAPETTTSSSGEPGPGDGTGTESDGTDSTGEEPDENGDAALGLTWIKTGTQARLIGLDARSDEDIWVGGTDSVMMRSRDGGESWQLVLVSDDPADSELQFRDVAAVGRRTIYALAAGEGDASRIYRSSDGGDSWELQYKPSNENVFIDCFDFWDRNNGIVYGDSLGAELFMLRTEDGEDWSRIDGDRLPAALENEGGFAASGTCAVALGRRGFMIATGAGERPRVLKTTDKGDSWTAVDVPVAGGTKASGLTSVVMWSEDEGLALATDLETKDPVKNAVAFTEDGGETWTARDFVAPAPGFFGAASNSDGSMVIGVSPAGMFYSTDKGVSWTQVSKQDLWSVDFADDRTAFAVGAEGTVVRIEVKR